MFRFFARKVLEKVGQNSAKKQDVLSVEFEKYLQSEISAGKSEEEVASKIISQKSMQAIMNAIKSGEEIDITSIDVNFPEDLESKLDKIIENEPSPGHSKVEVEKGLPSDIDKRLQLLNKLKNL